MIRKSFILIFSVFTQFNCLHAQGGVLDVSFDSDGIVIMDISNSNDVMKSIVVQSDGKIIVAGYTSDMVTDNFCLLRYKIDGSIDTGFGLNGIVTTTFTSTSIGSDVALQDDGKIIVVGHTWGGIENEFALARYNTDGILDNSFGNLGLVSTSFPGKNAIARSLIIQDNGKIVVAGHVYTLNNDFDEFALARYNHNGSLDTTFGTAGLVTTSFGGGTKNWINSIQLQSDGKVVAAGFSNDLFALSRYNLNGTLDLTFGIAGLVTTPIPGTIQSAISSIALADDGSIFGGGYSVQTVSNFTLVKYDSSGNLDNSFGVNGILVTEVSVDQDGIADILIQSNNKILVAGNTYETGVNQFSLVRYNSLGGMDPTFGTNGIVKTIINTNFNQLEAIALQSDGKILATGFVGDYPYDLALSRYTSTFTNVVSQETPFQNITIYPNPTSNKLSISFGQINEGKVDLKIYDTRGQLIQEKIIYTSILKTKKNEVLHLSQYPAGTYFISLNANGTEKTFTVVLN